MRNRSIIGGLALVALGSGCGSTPAENEVAGHAAAAVSEGGWDTSTYYWTPGPCDYDQHPYPQSVHITADGQAVEISTLITGNGGDSYAGYSASYPLAAVNGDTLSFQPMGTYYGNYWQVSASAFQRGDHDISVTWLVNHGLPPFTFVLTKTPPPTGIPIIAVGSGKCLDVTGWATTHGKRIQQWDCGGGANQQWTLQPTAGGFAIVGVGSGKCLDVTAQSLYDNGAIIQQWDCSGSANQTWSPRQTPYGVALVSAASGKCLDVTGASNDNGVGLQQWDCLDAPQQSFRY